ncbi:hypothetical protein DAEQUDRAFT_759346 [Daedalea quercina L-15889]|uniref:Uncharacterized protein n=1 Tax=Daedalea quercina L-15889 TaxID=1314783 RepID=A0A165MBP8_9APHY|nr:hypothetical protein DAEQUDRAFT_759346 [Daedalea quercina L-15889]
MASAHSFPSLETSSSVSLDAPPPSQEPPTAPATVPNVFVIPPEEEQDENPPFCYFDATNAAHYVHSTTPDVDALEIALHFHQQIDNRAPAFRRSLPNDSQETIVLPRRGSLALIRENVVEEQKENQRRKVMDEDVVEVFKVRRSEGKDTAGEVQGQGIKKSRTFRLRATEALKSIKNVGKMPRRTSASSSSSSWGSEENVQPPHPIEQAAEQNTVPRPSTSKLLRRKSLTLSQVFTFSQNQRPTAAEAVSDPLTCTSPGHRPTLAESDADSLGMSAEGSPLPQRSYSMQTVPAIASPSKAHSHRIHPSPSIEDYGQAVRAEAPTAPASRLSRRRSFRNRISVLDLHKLFSQGSSSAAVEEQPEVSARASSDLAASTSTFSSYSLISAGSLTEDELRRRSLDQGRHEDPFGGDLDTEMRLDSLHFDSLHFDPDEF